MATVIVLLLPQIDSIMKKFIVIAMVCMANMVTVTAQKNQVPAAAEKAFRQKFPEAQHVTWDKESKDEYEAAFLLNGKKGSANFSASGHWIETEIAVAQSATPKIVIDGFSQKFPRAKVNEVFQISSASGKDHFEIEYTLKGKKKEVRLSTSGVVI